MTETFTERLQSIVDRLDPEVRSDAQQHLNDVLAAGGHHREGLVTLVSDPAVRLSTRIAAGWIIGRLGDKGALSILHSALGDPDAGIRAASARALGDIGDKRAYKALRSALKDRDTPVRRIVALALGDLGTRWATKPLVTAMLTDEAAEVRQAAVYALGELFDERALEPILSVLSNPSEEPIVRGMAAEQTTHFQSRRAEPFLIAALRDQSPEVRFWAAFALGSLGGPEALPDLGRLAATDEESIPDWGPIRVEALAASDKIRRRLAGEDASHDATDQR